MNCRTMYLWAIGGLLAASLISCATPPDTPPTPPVSTNAIGERAIEWSVNDGTPVVTASIADGLTATLYAADRVTRLGEPVAASWSKSSGWIRWTANFTNPAAAIESPCVRVQTTTENIWFAITNTGINSEDTP